MSRILTRPESLPTGGAGEGGLYFQLAGGELAWVGAACDATAGVSDETLTAAAAAVPSLDPTLRLLLWRALSGDAAAAVAAGDRAIELAGDVPDAVARAVTRERERCEGWATAEAQQVFETGTAGRILARIRAGAHYPG